MPHFIELLRFRYLPVRNITLSRTSSRNQAAAHLTPFEQSIDNAGFRAIYCSFKNLLVFDVRGRPHFYQMAETLGEKLRAARESRGISISEVAEQTRIAPMYIECIENDNYKPLPGGIFNKGFVKSYARFIGVDEQEALQDYTRLISQTGDTAPLDEPRTYRPEVLTDDRASQTSLSTIIFAGIILALMAGAIYLLVNYLRSQPTEPAVATNTTTPANQAAGQSNQATAPAPAAGDIPTMQNVKIEFRTATEPISLSSTADGKTSVNTVTPTTPQTFEPKESIKLSYAKSLASSAQLFINGKQITLPTQPANPKRVPIEIEINASNLAQVWQSGQFTFAVQAPANTATTTVPTNTAPRPAANANTAARANTNTAAANRPAVARSPAAANSAPRATPRPNANQ